MSNEDKIRVLRDALYEAVSQARRRLSELPYDIRHRDDRMDCERAIERAESALAKTDR